MAAPRDAGLARWAPGALVGNWNSVPAATCVLSVPWFCSNVLLGLPTEVDAVDTYTSATMPLDASVPAATEPPSRRNAMLLIVRDPETECSCMWRPVIDVSPSPSRRPKFPSALAKCEGCTSAWAGRVPASAIAIGTRIKRMITRG